MASQLHSCYTACHSLLPNRDSYSLEPVQEKQLIQLIVTTYSNILLSSEEHDKLSMKYV